MRLLVLVFLVAPAFGGWGSDLLKRAKAGLERGATFLGRAGDAVNRLHVFVQEIFYVLF